MTTWIKTSEQMPEFETPVLAIWSGEYCILERIQFQDEEKAPGEIMEYWNDSSISDEILDREVTHWMSIPPLPDTGL